MARVVLSIWLAVVLIAMWALPAWAGDPVETGLDYLAAQQQADGGFRPGHDVRRRPGHRRRRAGRQRVGVG
jgi:hypothetical protein